MRPLRGPKAQSLREGFHGALFRDRFMDIDVSLPLEKALDISWQTLGECFEPQELLMKQALVDKYYPRSKPT